MAEKVTLPEVTILGRTVQFRQFNDTQLVLIHRMRQMLSGAMGALPDNPTPDMEVSDVHRRAMESGLDVVAKFLDMIGFMVVSDEDREWLTMQMLAGNLDLEEIGRFVPDLVGKDETPKKAAKKAVRAR
jgi:hypothetical protein